MKRLIIVGGGKGADLVIDYLKKVREHDKFICGEESVEILGIVDDNTSGERGGVPVIGKVDDVRKYSPSEVVITCSSSKMQFRRIVYDKFREYEMMNVLISDDIEGEIGQGNFIFDNVRVGRFAKVGDNNVISSYTCINHHNRVGSSNLFGPGCMLSGSVTIGDNCTFGSGIIFENGIKVGNNCTIPSGTVVVGDLADNTRILAHIAPNMGFYVGSRVAGRRPQGK